MRPPNKSSTVLTSGDQVRNDQLCNHDNPCNFHIVFVFIYYFADDNPILILTHGDKLTTEERLLGRIAICECLGIQETTGAYDIACMTENGISPEESDPVTAFALTEAIYRALIQSDRTHLPKRRAIDWILLWMSWMMCAISAFFASLAYVFSKMARKNRLKML